VPGKSISVSVRLTSEEAQSLDKVEIPGAENQSEKLRTIIRQTLQIEEGKHSYPAGLKLIDSLLDPIRQSVWDQERREHRHSELITRVYEWVPDMMAYILASTDPEPDTDEQITLDDFESGIADRVFRLMEATLRLALSDPNPCYGSDTVTQRLQPSLQLAKLIETMTKEQNDA